MIKILKRATKFLFRKIKELLILTLSYCVFRNKKVGVLVIGAQKCGTTSLHSFLDKHPQCKGAPKKEVRFFTDFFDLGESWYHKQFFKPTDIFQKGNRNKIYFESTPEYVSFPVCAKRISSYNPDMKMILLVREPVSRAYSAFNMWTQFAKSPDALFNAYKKVLPENRISIMYKLLYENEKYPFEYWVEKELALIEKGDVENGPFFIRTGCYVNHIKRFYSYFDKNNLLIFENKDLRDRKIETLNTIAHFLELNSIDWSLVDLTDKHERKYQNKMDNGLMLRLKSFYKPYNEELFSLINKRYDWER